MAPPQGRLTHLDEADLSAQQRAVMDAIASGPRGMRGLAGPFGVYVRVPEVGDPAQALGAAVRYDTELPENLKEIGICLVGAHYKAKFEFAAHGALACKAGVDPAIVESLRVGERPSFTNADEAIAYEVSRQLVHHHRIDDDTYARAVAALGERQVIELVTALGYYSLVSMVLNAFEVPLRDGMTDPFPEVT